MTKKKPSARLTSDARPTATNVDFPVFVPNESGETNIDVGKARLRYGTLVIEFKDTATAVAIQNMIERGVLLGLGMVMLKPDVVNEMYQEVVADEKLSHDARNQALEDGALVILDDELESVNPDKTVDEVISEYREKAEKDGLGSD